ncbi:MAG: hypothetical protein KIS61_25850 [Candidatus Eremiobacteraeota bacterium]|nr:hypothetical protein [Candidatus Eremiobacteraeota bacterium]
MNAGLTTGLATGLGLGFGFGFGATGFFKIGFLTTGLTGFRLARVTRWTRTLGCSRSGVECMNNKLKKGTKPTQ